MSDYQLPPEELERIRNEGRELFNEPKQEQEIDPVRKARIEAITKAVLGGYFEAKEERDAMLSGKNVVAFPKGGAS